MWPDQCLKTIFFLWCLNFIRAEYMLKSFEENGATYRAAAFQHVDPSNSSKNLQEIMLQSVDVYEQQIAIAASQDVDLIIFPEYGITGVSVPSIRSEIRPFLQVLPSVIPDPLMPWTPCLQPSDDSFNITILRRLSCAAIAHNIIVVANVGTIVQCETNTSCPLDGAYQFNTDIVFSQNGTILMTYHKVNLYLEPVFNRPPYPPDYVATFTALNITFGLITCFDILWEYPLITMVSEKEIKHVLMPTAWTDGLPYLTSVQSQEAWAIGLGINLIVANIQNSEDGYRGSGIYSGSSGYVNYTYDSNPVNTLITSEVPRIPGEPVSTMNPTSDMPYTEYSGIIYDDLSLYSFVQLHANNVSNIEGNATLQRGNITCSLSYKFDSVVDHGDYFMAAYDGKITLGYGTYVLAIEMCSLVWCSNASDPINSCAKPQSTVPSSNLLNLTITAKLNTNFVYPNILKHDLQLVDKSSWVFAMHNSTVMKNCLNNNQVSGEISGQTTSQLNTLETFSNKVLVSSLYGRRYDLDTSST